MEGLSQRADDEKNEVSEFGDKMEELEQPITKVNQ